MKEGKDIDYLGVESPKSTVRKKKGRGYQYTSSKGQKAAERRKQKISQLASAETRGLQRTLSYDDPTPSELPTVDEEDEVEVERDVVVEVEAHDLAALSDNAKENYEAC